MSRIQTRDSRPPVWSGDVADDRNLAHRTVTARALGWLRSTESDTGSGPAFHRLSDFAEQAGPAEDVCWRRSPPWLSVDESVDIALVRTGPFGAIVLRSESGIRRVLPVALGRETRATELFGGIDFRSDAPSDTSDRRQLLRAPLDHVQALWGGWEYIVRSVIPRGSHDPAGADVLDKGLAVSFRLNGLYDSNRPLSQVSRAQLSLAACAIDLVVVDGSTSWLNPGHLSRAGILPRGTGLGGDTAVPGDLYSVTGTVRSVTYFPNPATGAQVVQLHVTHPRYSGLDLFVAAADLDAEPVPGNTVLGAVWLQGTLFGD
jgi:hypothetical protein